MNAGLENSTHPSIIYYDGDYPSLKDYSEYPENFDDTVEMQGLAFDVEKYAQLGKEIGNEILELCCGTGRIAIPLAASGFSVTAVDFSPMLLSRFKDRLKFLDGDIETNIRIFEQDVTELSLENTNYDLVICGFNSLLCLNNFESQMATLHRAAKHLKPDGMLVLDLMNPFVLNLAGDPNPKPFFTRRNPATGNQYTRFAAMGPVQVDQKQKLFGWYDEIEKDGRIKRSVYEMSWRLIFRYEIELMLEKAGFKIENVWGGHRNEEFIPSSRKMFIEAVKL